MAENELKPMDMSKLKTATSRIDLNKATVPGIPTAGIKLGANAKRTTGKIEISAGPALDEDIYKRRTALLDTSHIPLSAAQTAPAGAPKTIRIGNRPTIRVNKPGVPATFSPGQPDAPSAADSAAGGGGRPAIRLKRPGGATVSVPAGGGETMTTMSPTLETSDGFVVRRDEEESSPVWAVLALLGVLAGIGVVVTQFLTKNLMPY